MNKIDDHEDEGDHEDEKPPGEETQAEFEVTAFAPDEKPAETIVHNTNEPDLTVEKAQTNNESTLTEKSTTIQQDVTAVSETVTSVTNVTTESDRVSGIVSQAINDSQANSTLEGESEKMEASAAPRTKAARGRKRQAAAGRKKAPARNAKAKKVVEDIVSPEAGVENNNDTDGLTGSEEEVKKAKVDGELAQESTGTDETAEEETPMDTKPKRVTRARAQRRKK